MLKHLTITCVSINKTYVFIKDFLSVLPPQKCRIFRFIYPSCRLAIWGDPTKHSLSYSLTSQKPLKFWSRNYIKSTFSCDNWPLLYSQLTGFYAKWSQWDKASISSTNSFVKNLNFIVSTTVIIRWNFTIIQGKNSNIFWAIICNLLQQEDLATFFILKTLQLGIFPE